MSDTGNAKAPGKLAGKFDTPEELAKGYMDSQRQLNELKAQMAQVKAQADASARTNEQFAAILETLQKSQPQPVAEALWDEDHGRLNEVALDARIQRHLQPFQNLQGQIQQAVNDVLAPVVNAANAKGSIIGRKGFREESFQQFLSENMETSQRFNEFLKHNPEGAYDYAYLAYKEWLANSQPEEEPTLRERKKAAKPIEGHSGPPVDVSGEGELAQDRLKKQALAAQGSLHTDGQLAFFKNWAGDDTKLGRAIDRLKRQYEDGLEAPTED